MRLAVNKIRQNAAVTNYPEAREVTTLEELLEVAKYDHVPGVLREGHRADANILSADCVYIDFDNTHSADSAQWVKPEEFRGYNCFVVFSRNNEKPKNGMPPAPRFHVYFKLKSALKNAQEILSFKERLFNKFPLADTKTKPASQCVFGVANPEGFEFTGQYIEDCLPPAIEYIPAGKRNKSMYDSALKILLTFEDDSEAFKKFQSEAQKCDPQLAPAELSTIWHSALKSPSHRAFLATLKISEDYPDKAPEEIRAELAEHIAGNASHITRGFNAALKILGKEMPKKAQHFKSELTQRALEKLLKAKGVRLRMNVYTGDPDITLPDDSEYLPDCYLELTEKKKRQRAGGFLPFYIQELAVEAGFKKPQLNSLERLLSEIAACEDYNPVKELLEKTPWDGVDRFSELLKLMGIQDTPRACEIMRKFFVQGCAMVYNEGDTRLDFAPVFLGKQGCGKTLLTSLIGISHDFFLEAARIDMKDKDTLISANSKFLVELGEGDWTLGKGQSALKSYLTSPMTDVRKPFAAKPMRVPRHNVFILTTNEQRMLFDDTGNRRFPVIELTHMDTLGIRALANCTGWGAQLWAQMYETAYKSGADYRLTAAEISAGEVDSVNHLALKLGQQELLDLLDWDAPQSDWRLISSTDLAKELDLKFDGATIGRALRAIQRAMPELTQKSTGKIRRGWWCPQKRGAREEIELQNYKEPATVLTSTTPPSDEDVKNWKNHKELYSQMLKDKKSRGLGIDIEHGFIKFLTSIVEQSGWCGQSKEEAKIAIRTELYMRSQGPAA